MKATHVIDASIAVVCDREITNEDLTALHQSAHEALKEALKNSSFVIEQGEVSSNLKFQDIALANIQARLSKIEQRLSKRWWQL